MALGVTRNVQEDKGPPALGNIDVSGQLSRPGDSHTRCDTSLALQKGKDETEEREWMSRHRIVLVIRTCTCERIKCFSALGGLEVYVI